MPTAFDPATSVLSAVKKFLREEHIEFPNDGEESQLRLKAHRRVLRKHLGSGPTRVRGARAAMNLAKWIDMLDKITKAGYGPKAFESFNAKLLFTEPTVTVLRHSADCRSYVTAGICKRCQVATAGVACFSFSFMMCDLKDSSVKYELTGYKAAAKCVFGNKSADDVRLMEDDAVADVLEQWSEVPVSVSAVVEYDIVKSAVRVSPYKISPMPLDYTTDYTA